MADQPTLFPLDPIKAQQRADDRAKAKRDAKREAWPPVMPGFFEVIVECVSEHLRAGVEYDEMALRWAQRSALAELDPRQREDFEPVGLDHPAMTKPIDRAIGDYQMRNRIRIGTWHPSRCVPPAIYCPPPPPPPPPPPHHARRVPDARARDPECCACGVRRPSTSSVACWYCGDPWPPQPDQSARS